MSVPMQRYPIFNVSSPLQDLLFYEVVDYNIKSNRDMVYGTPHHNIQAYPHHVLVYIEPNDKEAKTYRFYYAAKREDQDLYNFTSGYENVGGLMLQSVSRIYVSLRESFIPFGIPIGSAIANIPEGKFSSGYILHKTSQVKASQELESIFVFEEHTYILPKSVEGDEYGSVVTMTNTIESVVPDTEPVDTGIAVVQSSITPLGNGQAVKQTKIVKDGAWPAIVEHTKSKSRDNLVPQKFRNFVLAETTTAKLATMPGTITLSMNEVNKTVKKETPNRYDVSTTTEIIDSNTFPLTGSQVFFQFGGGIATSSESLVIDGTQSTGGFLVLSSSVSPLGNGKSIQEIVTSNAAYPQLNGQKYDSTYDIEIPFIKQVIPAGSTQDGADITPLDQWKSQLEKVDVDSLQSQLLQIHTIMPTRQSVQLPNTLLSAGVSAIRTLSNGDGITIGESSGGSVDSSLAVSADLHWEIKEGYTGPVPAEVHVFFLKLEDANINNIKAKTGADEWPLFQPKSYRLVLTGHGVTKGFSWSNSAGGGSATESGRISPFSNVAVIPSCIHNQIDIGVSYHDYQAPNTLIDDYRDAILDAYESRVDQKISEVQSGYYNGYPIDPARKDFLITRLNATKSVQSFLSDLEFGDFEVRVDGQESKELEPTTPECINPGKYVYDTNIKVYGYGLVQVTAIVVDLTTVV